MKTDLRKVLPLGFLACLGAPIAYVAYAVITNAVAGKDFDGALVFTMLVAALVLSFIATMIVVVATIVVARFMGFSKVNIPFVAIGWVLVLTILVTVLYGLPQGLVFAVLSSVNGGLFVLFGKYTRV